MSEGTQTYRNFLISEDIFLKNLENCRNTPFPVDKTRKFFDIIAFVISTKLFFRHNLIYFNSYEEGAKKLNISASTLRKRISDCKELGLANRISGVKWSAKYAYEIASLKNKEKKSKHVRIIIYGRKKKDIVKAIYVGYSAWIFSYKDAQARRLLKLATQKWFSASNLCDRDKALLGRTGVKTLLRLRGCRGKFKNNRSYQLYAKNEAMYNYQLMSYYTIDKYYHISKSRMYRTSKSMVYQSIITTDPIYLIHNVRRITYQNAGLIPVPRVPYKRRGFDESRRIDYIAKQEIIGKVLDMVEGEFTKKYYDELIKQRQNIQKTARERHQFTTVRKASPYTRTLPDYDGPNPLAIVRWQIGNSCVIVDRLPNMRTKSEQPGFRLIQRYKYFV